MRNLQATITHTASVTTAVERYVSDEPYKRNGRRSKKGHELHNLGELEQAEESKRTFKGIIHANYEDTEKLTFFMTLSFFRQKEGTFCSI
ncbi:hypothetical protein D1953_11825 [Peribacillus asahii]|uniref:Uncharacterized protein n=1 Tax=Peribacillus asahii TaxID=228899 RepID=A0A398B8W3_9BACI|nr:hypothetical protein [Peribacillus asahii]RID85278.1 hypothetical protein D1953_11825 [Peribacillus asahii]